MIFAFYILAAMLIFLSYRSFRGGIDYLNYFKRELAKPRSEFTPYATIIAPCKGMDEGLDENLAALIEQDYQNFEVVFVVDCDEDPAVSAIKELSRKGAKYAKKPKLVIAQKAIESSQKVENLREAVLHTSKESEVFVFVDSDARPSKDWLRHLVAPLADESIGAATGYRWFISKKESFASEMRNIWNASIASALGANKETNFCWGGSMAIRRETFERLDISGKWRGTLSDDFTVTRVLKAAGLGIHFVPQALTASIDYCTFREMLEFTTRQMKITRVYAPQLWLLSFFGSGLFCTVMAAAFLIVIFNRQNDAAGWIAISTIVLVTLFSVGKSWLRIKAVKLVLVDHSEALRLQTLPQLTLWLLAPAVFFYNSFAALFSRKMTWRGIKYELVSATETRVIEKRS